MPGLGLPQFPPQVYFIWALLRAVLCSLQELYMVTPASPLPRPLLAHKPLHTSADLKLATTLGHIEYITTSAHFVQARPRARPLKGRPSLCCARART